MSYSFGRKTLSCNLHSDKEVVGVCFGIDCIPQPLCQSCLTPHQMEHPHEVETIGNVLSGQVSKGITPIVTPRNSVIKADSLDEIMAQIDDVLKQLVHKVQKTTYNIRLCFRQRIQEMKARNKDFEASFTTLKQDIDDTKRKLSDNSITTDTKIFFESDYLSKAIELFSMQKRHANEQEHWSQMSFLVEKVEVFQKDLLTITKRASQEFPYQKPSKTSTGSQTSIPEQQKEKSVTPVKTTTTTTKQPKQQEKEDQTSKRQEKIEPKKQQRSPITPPVNTKTTPSKISTPQKIITPSPSKQLQKQQSTKKEVKVQSPTPPKIREKRIQDIDHSPMKQSMKGLDDPAATSNSVRDLNRKFDGQEFENQGLTFQVQEISIDELQTRFPVYILDGTVASEVTEVNSMHNKIHGGPTLEIRFADVFTGKKRAQLALGLNKVTEIKPLVAFILDFDPEQEENCVILEGGKKIKLFGIPEQLADKIFKAKDSVQVSLMADEHRIKVIEF